MIKPIMKNPIFLAQKSAPATIWNLPVAQELRDTLQAHVDSVDRLPADRTILSQIRNKLISEVIP